MTTLSTVTSPLSAMFVLVLRYCHPPIPETTLRGEFISFTTSTVSLPVAVAQHHLAQRRSAHDSLDVLLIGFDWQAIIMDKL